jgi:excisionase family DNA binding protein
MGSNEMSAQMDEDLMNVKAVAKYLGYSAWTIYQLVKKEKIPYIRTPGGDLRFRPSKIEAWRDECDGDISSCVYFIQGGPERLIKIGYTRSPEQRFKLYKTESPVPLMLLAAWPGTIQDEGALHKRFSAYRHHNEWFYPVPELIAFINENSSYIEPINLSDYECRPPQPFISSEFMLYM